VLSSTNRSATRLVKCPIRHKFWCQFSVKFLKSGMSTLLLIKWLQLISIIKLIDTLASYCALQKFYQLDGATWNGTRFCPVLRKRLICSVNIEVINLNKVGRYVHTERVKYFSVVCPSITKVTKTACLYLCRFIMCP
jgi:hypothetical protein